MLSLLLFEKHLVEKWSTISRTILLCPFIQVRLPSPLAIVLIETIFRNLQEIYLKTQSARVRYLDKPEKRLKELQLMERAAARW